jgi:dethiobiotin synthetase
MKQGYFVTGTDTGVGKTRITLALMHALQKDGSTVTGMKPVASGCDKTSEGLRNEDALLLQAQSSIDLLYESINPYAFELPVSPHIAAEKAGAKIQIDVIHKQMVLLMESADCLMVEGVGGWHVPLCDQKGDQKNTEDLAIALGLPVILVVGMRLGCLNHALLTHEAIIRSGLQCAGWVANQVDPDFSHSQENIETLKAQIKEPLIGVVPFQESIETGQISDFLDISLLENIR